MITNDRNNKIINSVVKGRVENSIVINSTIGMAAQIMSSIVVNSEIESGLYDRSIIYNNSEEHPEVAIVNINQHDMLMCLKEGKYEGAIGAEVINTYVDKNSFVNGDIVLKDCYVAKYWGSLSTALSNCYINTRMPIDEKYITETEYISITDLYRAYYKLFNRLPNKEMKDVSNLVPIYELSKRCKAIQEDEKLRNVLLLLETTGNLIFASTLMKELNNNEVYTSTLNSLIGEMLYFGNFEQALERLSNYTGYNININVEDIEVKEVIQEDAISEDNKQNSDRGEGQDTRGTDTEDNEDSTSEGDEVGKSEDSNGQDNSTSREGSVEAVKLEETEEPDETTEPDEEPKEEEPTEPEEPKEAEPTEPKEVPEEVAEESNNKYTSVNSLVINCTVDDGVEIRNSYLEGMDVYEDTFYEFKTDKLTSPKPTFYLGTYISETFVSPVPVNPDDVKAFGDDARKALFCWISTENVPYVQNHSGNIIREAIVKHDVDFINEAYDFLIEDVFNEEDMQIINNIVDFAMEVTKL